MTARRESAAWNGVCMRRYVGVLIIGIIFALIGLAAVGSAGSRSATTTFSIPPGAGYYTYYKFDTAGSGAVTVQYTSDSGIVGQYVLTDTEYSDFKSGSAFTYLGFDSSAGNTFTTDLSGAGTYYVVSVHGVGYDNVTQSGSHTMTINALDPVPFYLGIAFLVLGLILVVVAVVLRSRPEKQVGMPTPPPYLAGYGAAAPPPYTGGAAMGLPQSPGQAPPTAGPRPWPTQPAAAPSAFGGAPATGMLLVTLENHSQNTENVQLIMDGVPAATVPVPPGGTGQATLRPALTFPAGTTVRVEAVMADGRRASQEVVVSASAPANISLRIG